jgi:DNA-binding NarL/FixJ family response regulator
MDITMPGMSGLEATREITHDQPGANVLILTIHDNRSVINQSQLVGAGGLLSKTEATSELTIALQTIIAGENYFH